MRKKNNEAKRDENKQKIRKYNFPWLWFRSATHIPLLIKQIYTPYLKYLYDNLVLVSDVVSLRKLALKDSEKRLIPVSMSIREQDLQPLTSDVSLGLINFKLYLGPWNFYPLGTQSTIKLSKW